MKNMVVLLSMIFSLSACATIPKIQAVKICEDQRCETTVPFSNKEIILKKMYKFLKNSQGVEIRLSESDPATKHEKKEGLGFLVSGIHGQKSDEFGDFISAKVINVLYVDQEKSEIKFTALLKTNQTYFPCEESEGVFSILETGETVMVIKTRCTFTLQRSTAQSRRMPWKVECFLDHIDFDKKLLGAYYRISGGLTDYLVTGRGYQLASFSGGRPDQAVEQSGKTAGLAVTKPQPPEQVIQALLESKVTLAEPTGKGILLGGNEATLRVEVRNYGERPARAVEVILSGHHELVDYLGEKKGLGDIPVGESKIAEFKAKLPYNIPSTITRLKVEVKERAGSAPPEMKTLKVAMKSMEEPKEKESVEVLSQPPRLVYRTALRDQNQNRILDGGEEVVLNVEVENQGAGIARDVQVVLTGHKGLVGYLGKKKYLGNIGAGEKKTATFRTTIPAQIPSETASLRVEIKEGSGFSPLDRKVLKVAMRPAAISREIEEVISEVDVDDLPRKIPGYRKDADVALVIGISKYREKAIPEVKYAHRDAELMAKYLENIGGIPHSNIKVLANDTATKSDLEAYFEDWLPRRVKPDSTVYVYYAGHGTPDPHSGEAFIVPYEGHPDFPSKLFPLQRMYDSLNKLPARNVVVMLDSCFSGAKGRSIIKEGSRPLVINMSNPMLSGGKIIVLASSTGSQISSDYEKVQHGLFTYYLLRGMRGEADKIQKGTVDLGDLYDYVKSNVSAKASVELNRDQTPLLLPSTQILGGKLEMPITRIR